ncbi:hypothetical protein TNIN_59941 [Trichonephila inaurata madagascariensis]|uniref:Uncharacterized protein n=1 Tax=Trichonephila inaurata madagascariensis TaxID=2747483 RepID=A0A8X6YJD9_9ARAC|nr:hypothetical protein TNIN_59941 [Trichonephila inaurata madagascariensis]
MGRSPTMTSDSLGDQWNHGNNPSGQTTPVWFYLLFPFTCYCTLKVKRIVFRSRRGLKNHVGLIISLFVEGYHKGQSTAFHVVSEGDRAPNAFLEN